EHDGAHAREGVAAADAFAESLACAVAAPCHGAMLVGGDLGGWRGGANHVAREPVADRACREEHDRAREPYPACAVGRHERACDDRAYAGEGEGGAHDERERATAQLVDDSSLHE